ncbi:GNAT family N-acetyltransferase [Pseudoalteromonas denitrificans]|uniref:Phosphinothricin acetyltransferase n=1 Tax=Pseudoalteromonas denitrificans DSM 6059 TaxID=1123010 RepID=A0A1I1U4A2_9GAMM|nr:GNAT family N-acetyltransferase [Pseudoalteromonas denitrificans]SFD65681.1 phosphinothricin acetyltransferase [Pseudoalteromonas denitrificans DSM 6059]
MIRAVKTDDIDSIVHIYNHYINNSIVTFETQSITAEQMKERIDSINKDGLPWLIAEDDGNNIIGYAYASKWKGRCAYKHSVEITVYLNNKTTEKGWGSKLYAGLFKALKNRNIHTAIGGIALPNPASIALHEKFGMKKAAHFEQVGQKFDKWIDVGYWQCILSD